MPLLAGFIGSLIAALVEFFSLWITKRLAIVTALIVVAVTLTVAFMGAVKALIAGVTVAVPSAVVTGASFFLPYNSGACVAAVLAGHVLRWAYDWNIKTLQYKLI